MPFNIHITPPDFTPSDEEERQLWASLAKIKRSAFETLRDRMENGYETDAELPWATKPPGFDFPMTFVHIDLPLKSYRTVTPPPELVGSGALAWIAARIREEMTSQKFSVFATLQTVTRLSAVARYAGKTHFVIPHAMLDTYKALSKAERDAYVERWFSWVQHGDGWAEELEVQGNEELGKTLYVPVRPSVSVEHEGKTWQASLVFDVSPLLINLDDRSFGYIARVAMFYTGTLGSPDTWPESERAALWEAVLASFGNTADLEGGTSLENPSAHRKKKSAAKGRSVVSEDDPPHDDSADRALGLLQVVSEEKAQEAFVTSERQSRRVYPAAFREIIMDKKAADYIQDSRSFGLPRDYARVLRWDAITEKEIAAWLSEPSWDPYKEGKGGGKPFLKRVTSHGVTSTERSVLTEAGETYIKLQYGQKGFIFRDSKGNESFCQCRQATDGALMEWHISIFDLVSERQSAAPLIDSWRTAQKREIEEDEQRLRQLSFFDMDASRRALLQRRTKNIFRAERLQYLMEVIAGQVLTRGEYPVIVPAEVLCDVVYRAEPRPANWKQEIDDTLEALRVMRITVRRKDSRGDSQKRFGFLSHVGSYVPRGPGAHGNGYYVLPMHEEFLGCLRVFEDGERTIKAQPVRVLNFGKQLSTDEKKELNYIRWHSGTPVLSSAAGYDRYQHALVRFIERNITLQKDAVHGGKIGHRSAQQVRGDHPNASRPRIYTTAFCPFLEPGKEYVAALGHFPRGNKPERGWALLGTERSPRLNAGGSPGGLIYQSGRHVPSGRTRERISAIYGFLDDLQRVVINDFGGMVFGRFNPHERSDGGKEPQWVRFEDFRSIEMEALGYQLKVFIFLPTNWRDRFTAVFEDKKNVRVTDSPEEAAAVAFGTAQDVVPMPSGEVWGRENGWAGRPLVERLHAAMKDRGLKRTDLAQIFRVTKGTVSRWMAKGDASSPPLRIPEDLAALMGRWLETGEAPSADDLEALESRRRSPARR